MSLFAILRVKKKEQKNKSKVIYKCCLLVGGLIVTKPHIIVAYEYDMRYLYRNSNYYNVLMKKQQSILYIDVTSDIFIVI